MNARLTLASAAVALGLISAHSVVAQTEVDLNGAGPAVQTQPAAAAAAPAAATPVNGDLQAVARAIEDLRMSLSERLDQMDRKMVTREQLNQALQAETEAAMSRFAAKADLDNYVPRSEFETLQKDFEELQQSFNDQAAQISQFRQDMSTQITALDDQSKQIQSIVNAISRPDSQQRPILDVRSSMASSEFRTDLSNAVNEALPRQGTVVVTNQMTTTQYLRVNGQMYSVPPFSSSRIAVPVGTLTTELTGEAPKNWTISPPNFEQGIIIAPRQTPTVVASPVVFWNF